jgi:hypothetical protein
MSSLVGRPPASSVWRPKRSGAPDHSRPTLQMRRAGLSSGLNCRSDQAVRPACSRKMLPILVTTSARAPGGEAVVAMALTKPKSRTSPHSRLLAGRTRSRNVAGRHIKRVAVSKSLRGNCRSGERRSCSLSGISPACRRREESTKLSPVLFPHLRWDPSGYGRNTLHRGQTPTTK